MDESEFMCSLPKLLSLSSFGGLEMTLNCLHRSTGLACVTLEDTKPRLILPLDDCLVASAIFASHVVVNIFSNKSQEILGLIATNQNHFVVGADVSLATELRQEVIQDMLMFSL
jgi:hypothetical protein